MMPSDDPRIYFSKFILLSLLSYCFHQILSLPIEAVTTNRRGAIHQTITTWNSILTASSNIYNSGDKDSSNDHKTMSVLNDTTETRGKVRWGIIGLGDVCKIKSGPPFYKCKGSELVAVMRRTPGKAKEFAAKVPGGKCIGYENLDEFLQHPGLDAVYVSTRPGTHLDICREVAKAGKACYVEKPVGRCAEETEEITSIFRNANLPLYTAYISRAYEKTQAIRKLMEAGTIGDKITNITYKCVGQGGARDMEGELPWRLDAIQSGGGLVMDVGCHILDRIDYLCGPITKVNGEAKNMKSPNIAVEDYVHITGEIGTSDWAVLRNNEGCGVECTWDFASEESPYDELMFVGSNGFIKMGGSPSEPIEVFSSDGTFVQKLIFDMPEHTGQAMIQAVIDDLQNLNKSSYLSYGENAIRTQRVLDCVLDSYYGGREIGYWLRSESWPGKTLRK